MLIKWGAMVVDGRGKLGGHVGSQGRGGQVMFTKPRPNNPRSSFQTTQRAIFTQLSQGWSSLTPAQIRGWNEAVELFRYTNVFGDLKSLSGKALYQKLNANLILSDQATLSEAPVPAPVPTTPLDAATIGGTTGNVNVSMADSIAGQRGLIYGTPPVSAGTTYVADKFVFLYTASASGSGTFSGIGGYYDRFFVPSESDRIFLGIRIVNSVGQVSPMLTQIADIL